MLICHLKAGRFAEKTQKDILSGVFGFSVMDAVNSIKEVILRTLIKKRNIGGKHTPLDNITKNIPDEFLHNKQGKKQIEEAVKELVNEKFVMILIKKTGKGSDLHISINPEAMAEISALLDLEKEYSF